MLEHSYLLEKDAAEARSQVDLGQLAGLEEPASSPSFAWRINSVLPASSRTIAETLGSTKRAVPTRAGARE